jgi:hypothetical protein
MPTAVMAAEPALPGTAALLVTLAAARRSATGRLRSSRSGGHRAGDCPADLLKQFAYAVEYVELAKIEVSGPPL